MASYTSATPKRPERITAVRLDEKEIGETLADLLQRFGRWGLT